MAKFFINRPIFAWVIAICVMLSGIFSIKTLPIAQYPSIAPPQIKINATYPGADADTVENTVTKVIEDEMKGLDHFMYMNATSDSYGRCEINVYFNNGTNPDTAQVQVQNKLQAALTKLPEVVQRQGVSAEKSSSGMLLVVGGTSKDQEHDSTDVSDYLETTLKSDLSKLDGVGTIAMFGSKYAMRVWIDPDKMVNYGLSINEVSAAIQAQNAQISYGSLGASPALDAQKTTFTIVGQKKLSTVSEFENIVLKVKTDGSKVYLKNVADIAIGSESYDIKTSYNGNSAAGFSVSLAPGANALATAQNIKAYIAENKDYFPEWLDIVFPYDTSLFIEVSIEEVVHTLFEAIVLVVVIMYLFLKNFKATLIPSISVPVVLLGTFTVLVLFDYSINSLTLFGMVLAIGLLVDDAIVVVENVERILHEEPEITPKQATIKSMEEITGALVGVALVLSAVFVPMAFFGGSTGIIYRQFSITIVSAMVLSVLIAIILIPALCATMLKNPHKEVKKEPNALVAAATKPISYVVDRFNWIFNLTASAFEKKLNKVVTTIGRYFMYYACICVALAFGFMHLPSSFLPSEDQGVLLSIVSLPAGGTQYRTESSVNKVSDYFLQAEKENVISVFSVTGYSLSGYGPNNGMNFISLKDWSERTKEGQDADSIAARAYIPLLAGIRDGMAYAFNIPAIAELGTSSGVDFFIVDKGGKGHDALISVRNEFMKSVRMSPIFESIRPNGLEDTAQYRLKIDYVKATSLGLSTAEINDGLSAVLGSSYVDNFMDRGKIKKVFIQGKAEDRMIETDLNKWSIKNNEGVMIPFHAFVETEWTYGSPRLERFNGYSGVELLATPKEGFSSGQGIEELLRIGADVLPSGYTLSWYGQTYQEKMASSQGASLYAISVVVVFLSLAALYESWSIPVAVILVVPLGVIGSVIAALLTMYLPSHTTLTNDVYFQIGLLTTVGLAAKNAILIVEFAKDLYNKGESLVDAAVKAAQLRYRPILMTSLAFIFGVVPLAISSGAGSASRNEIGICVIGGMVTATIFAIFFVPVFFIEVSKLFKVKRDCEKPE